MARKAVYAALWAVLISLYFLLGSLVFGLSILRWQARERNYMRSLVRIP